MPKIPWGSKVRLNSGGPTMLVVDVKANFVECEWLAFKNGSLRQFSRSDFRVDCLTIVKPPLTKTI